MSLSQIQHVRRPFRPWKYRWDRDELIRLRHVERLSFPDLAYRFNCDHKTVMWAFKRLGIPTQIE